MNKKIILCGSFGLLIALNSNITKANEILLVKCLSSYDVRGQLKTGPSKDERLEFQYNGNHKTAYLKMEDENSRFTITYLDYHDGMEAAPYIYDKSPKGISGYDLVAGTLGPVKRQTDIMGKTHYKNSDGTIEDAIFSVECRIED